MHFPHYAKNNIKNQDEPHYEGTNVFFILGQNHSDAAVDLFAHRLSRIELLSSNIAAIKMER